MRRGAEEESWDRLAFELNVVARLQGSKKATFDAFHKFRQGEQKLNKQKLKSMKGLFGATTQEVPESTN